MDSIKRLCSEIETAIHHQLTTPKDFDTLREMVFSRLHILISATTLKRIWGYLSDGVTPRRGTLDILAQYLGYADFATFEGGSHNDDELPSSPIMARRIDVDDQLQQGDTIRLSWQPGRVCDVVYEGNRQFRVVASQNTRLKAGDTFKCGLIIDNEPLYIDGLVSGNNKPIAYVCGKKSGIHYEPLPSEMENNCQNL
ncbi:MAG: hypothetical protein SOZ05_06370 [Muribaculaceae bacterium]|nr:hypothetical protein [Muribaculaceae bacterium]